MLKLGTVRFRLVSGSQDGLSLFVYVGVDCYLSFKAPELWFVAYLSS
jgi:hypothetical protein